MQLEDVQRKYPDAREETDGSISFECPVCESDGSPGKRVTLYASGGLSCVRFAIAGMSAANRDHCRPIREALGLADDARKPFITKSLIDGKLTLEVWQVTRGKADLVARNGKSIYSRDLIALGLAKDRAGLIKSLSDFKDLELGEIN